MQRMSRRNLAWATLVPLLSGAMAPSCITDLRDAAQDGLFSFVTDTTITVLEDTFPPDEGEGS